MIFLEWEGAARRSVYWTREDRGRENVHIRSRQLVEGVEGETSVFHQHRPTDLFEQISA